MSMEIPWKTKLWHQWKSLRNVPFRRKWFVGYDLEGNSYWELKDYNNPFRLRRKVETAKQMHIGDYKACPQWMQWLRHTRFNAPTIEELLADQARQAKIKVLAQQAEMRWKAVPLKGKDDADPRITSAWDPNQQKQYSGDNADIEHASFEGNFTGDPMSARIFAAQNTIKEKDFKKKQQESTKNSNRKSNDPDNTNNPWHESANHSEDTRTAASFTPKR